MISEEATGVKYFSTLSMECNLCCVYYYGLDWIILFVKHLGDCVTNNLPTMPCHCEQEYYSKQAVSIAKEAGALVKAAFNIPNKKVDFKHDKNDLVTETDKQVEKLIFTKLKALFPSHKYSKTTLFI